MERGLSLSDCNVTDVSCWLKSDVAIVLVIVWSVVVVACVMLVVVWC